MARTFDLDLERFKRIPVSDDLWQVSVEPMAKWVVEEGKKPFRPLIGLACSAQTGLVGLGALTRSEEEANPNGLAAILQLSKLPEIRLQPTIVQVQDAGLRDFLETALAGTGILVEKIERLDLLDDVRERMEQEFAGPMGSHSLFAPDVEVERIRAFAEAAAAYYESALWNHLSDDDLMHVESRNAPEGMGWVTVLGGASITYGLGFFTSKVDHERFTSPEVGREYARSTPRWSLTFDPVYDLPIRDSDLWERHGLPTTRCGLYPLLVRFERPRRRAAAEADRLTWLEALLRTLAGTTEEEMDEGKWSRTVPCFGGKRTIALALPGVLELARPTRRRRALPPGEFPDRRLMERELTAMHRLVAEREWNSVDEINAFLQERLRGGEPATTEPTTAQELAQARYYEALEVQGRPRLKLAREALRIWPDFADALVLLAEEMPDPERRIDLFRRALDAAERTLEGGAFTEHVGHFWGVLETRPYMRARNGYAYALWDAGRRDEAIEHWLEMLRLNPNDNQGIRLTIVPRLLEYGRDVDAERILDEFAEDQSAVMVYTRALLDLRQKGEGDRSMRSLEVAVRRNRHVLKYLLAPDKVPAGRPPSYRLGSEEEAVIYASELHRSWKATPGALEWLGRYRKAVKRDRRKRR